MWEIIPDLYLTWYNVPRSIPNASRVKWQQQVAETKKKKQQINTRKKEILKALEETRMHAYNTLQKCMWLGTDSFHWQMCLYLVSKGCSHQTCEV